MIIEAIIFFSNLGKYEERAEDVIDRSRKLANIRRDFSVWILRNRVTFDYILAINFVSSRK